MHGRHVKPSPSHHIARNAALAAVVGGTAVFGTGVAQASVPAEDTGPVSLDSVLAVPSAVSHAAHLAHLAHEREEARLIQLARAAAENAHAAHLAHLAHLREEAASRTAVSDPAVTLDSAAGAQAEVAAYAKGFAGVPYVWGGTTTAGWDCSGFAQYVYAHFGVAIPRDSEDQYTAASPVAASKAVPGDLVFFLGNGGSYHTGIYLGGGEMISALDVQYGTLVSPVSWGGSVYAFGQFR